MPRAAITLPEVLREGDRLNSEEFLRRWEAIPDLKQAELIGGVVFMPSPVSHIHGLMHGRLSGWLCAFVDATPGCEMSLESTWRMTDESVPQPDLSLRILPECGGQSRLAGEYLDGAPELIVEVSGSTQSRDLGVKLDVYRRAGVREYVTVILNPRGVIWRELIRARYREIEPGEDGLLRSVVFPGLWLDPDALWSPNKPLRTAVELGIKTPEHAAFSRRLASRWRK